MNYELLSMNLFGAFKNYIKTEHLFSPKDRLLLAVSGGIDSIMLCRLCKEAGFDFSMAHCNFQLRNEESDDDEKFVEALSVELGVPFFTRRFDTKKYSTDHKLSIQVAARELRYKWFEELQQQENIPWLLTAHHADDNMETVMMNFFKGSGINGLKGILPKHKKIIRPLLFAKKEEILQYAVDNNISYRDDSSNSSDKYTRNYFRNQLIPALEKIFPQVKENLLQNANRFREINTIYEDAIEKIKQSLITISGNELLLPVLKLIKTPALKTVLFEITKPFGFTAAQSEETEKLLYSESGKYIQSATHRALRNRKWLIISPLAETNHSIYLLEENEAEIIFPAGKILIENFSGPQKIDASANIAQLNATHLKFPLLIRKWKQGDYFYPLGMQKKKKLSRFFTDQKLSLNEKENVWIIESDKKIIWIIGYRIDDRVKITENTKVSIRFSFLPA